MAKQSITYDEVAAVAARLKGEGIPPSLTNVAEALGKVAVSTELDQHLEQWFHTQPEFKRTITAPLADNIKVNMKGKDEKYVDLEKSLSLLRATLESTADGIMMVNGKGQVVDWNQKFVEMWRIPSNLMEAGPEHLSFEFILDQLLDPGSLIADVQFLYQNPSWQGELQELHFKDGRIFERYTQPQRLGNEIVGRVYSFRDVTQKRIADDELRVREHAIEASPNGIAIVDITKPEYPIMYVNQGFTRITGYLEKQTLGRSMANILGNKVDQINHKRIELAIREHREEMVELESIRRTGETYWAEISVAPVSDSFGKIRHYVFIINDITQRREMEKQLVQQATHDFLTELPNRVLLMDRVEQAILHVKKKNGILAFMFLDLDRFKVTNDTLGHSIGDKLLQAVSNRLLIATNDFDTVARIGGDEFVILLPEIQNESQALELAQNFLKAIEKPFQIENHTLKITASIGIGFYPKDGTDYESLMKNADLSMYHAKDSGRNTYRVFEQEMNQRMINYVQLDTALHDAMRLKEFFMVYQPLMNLKDETIVGFEALLRWNSHILGSVSPVQFIGMAEENGLILDIGQWVLEESCRQNVIWHEQGYDNLTVAVNVSGKQLHNQRLPELVAKILRKTGLPAKYLELELTESLLVQDIEKAINIMYQLKDMGVKIVIDDFGTGYSSLSYLKQLPVDKIKIDRSFINELVNDDNEAAIARAIIDLGHTLKLDVLAEGVETELQKQFLIKNGCDYAQGYYFKPPVKPDVVLELPFFPFQKV